MQTYLHTLKNMRIVMKRLISVCLAFVILLTVLPLNVFATNLDNEESGFRVRVNNGAGEFIGEYDSLQDFERNFLGTSGLNKLNVEPRIPIEAWLFLLQMN